MYCIHFRPELDIQSSGYIRVSWLFCEANLHINMEIRAMGSWSHSEFNISYSSLMRSTSHSSVYDRGKAHTKVHTCNMHTHKQATQCQETQCVRTMREFGKSGADNDSGLVCHGSSLRRSQLHDWQTALLLCFMGDKWVRNTEIRKLTTQWDEKLKDCNNCAVANTCSGILLSVCGVWKRPTSVWSVWLQWININ